MSSLKHLERYEKILKNAEFETKLYKPSKEFAVPFLVVNLGKDVEGRPRLLSISVQEQEMGEHFMPQEFKPESSLLHIQFEFEYPFPFDPAATNDLGSLLHFLNQQTKITALCMDEVELKIYYRYDIFTAEEGVTAKLLVAIIGMIMLFNDLYMKTIKAVAKGSATFNDVIEQLLAINERLNNQNKNK